MTYEDIESAVCALPDASGCLARALDANRHNIGGALSAHDFTAAQMEREGRRAFLNAGANPYDPGTMAHDRWQAGYRTAARIFMENGQ